MPIGYVYVLSNSAHSGLYKIGFTTDAVEARAGALSGATGVLAPFQIEYWRLTLRADEVERAVHKIFKAQRPNPKREFFRVDLDNIIEEIEKLVVNPPVSFRRTLPRPKATRLFTCKRCGHQFDKSAGTLKFCPKCGF